MLSRTGIAAGFRIPEPPWMVDYSHNPSIEKKFLTFADSQGK
jgi:hypothetical protein